jgi:hypothetical protein
MIVSIKTIVAMSFDPEINSGHIFAKMMYVKAEKGISKFSLKKLAKYIKIFVFLERKQLTTQ